MKIRIILNQIHININQTHNWISVHKDPQSVCFRQQQGPSGLCYIHTGDHSRTVGISGGAVDRALVISSELLGSSTSEVDRCGY